MFSTDTATLPKIVDRAGGTLLALTLDDDEIDRLRLMKTCRKAGLSIEFREVCNLEEFAEELDEHAFDIVFLDHNLGMDTGLDALKILRCHEDQIDAIPIMLTSVTSHHVAIDAMRSGCADYIIKEELTVDSLAKSITSAIERRVLFAELSNARAFESKLKSVIEKFMRSCGPEMREILSRNLICLRSIKNRTTWDEDLDPNLLANCTLLERGCNDLVALVDDLVSVVDTARGVSLRGQPNHGPAVLKEI